MKVFEYISAMQKNKTIRYDSSIYINGRGIRKSLRNNIGYLVIVLKDGSIERKRVTLKSDLIQGEKPVTFDDAVRDDIWAYDLDEDRWVRADLKTIKNYKVE